MNTQMAYWLTLNKHALSTVQQLAKINQQVVNTFMQHQTDMAEVYMDVGVNHMKNMASSKTPQAILEAQAQLAVNVTQKTAGHLRATLNMVSDTKNQLREWSENALKTTLNVAEASN